MKIVYALQEPPEIVTKSLFLVGPTPRTHTGGESWRPAMIEALERAGYDGVVYVPEPGDGSWDHDYTTQTRWEQRFLHAADLIIAWVPRDLKTMPAFSTNVEFGAFLDSGKLLYGRPKDAPKTRYLDTLYTQQRHTTPCSTLDELAQIATLTLQTPAPRTGGERSVPIDVWNAPQFQSWYQAQRKAGNRLDDAEVLWRYRVGPNRSFLFCFVVWVKVWIASENRHKENEVIFSRSDISTIVAYYRKDRPWGDDDTYFTGRTHIVLIKEFRSPARTADGFVHELPGGSSFNLNEDPRELAAAELEEETGLKIPSSRFVALQPRQMVSTLLTHMAHVYTVELLREEFQQAVETAQSGRYFGAGNTEQTYVEVRSLNDIINERLLDWANIGMIMEALYEA